MRTNTENIEAHGFDNAMLSVANLFKGYPEKESALVHWMRPFVGKDLVPDSWSDKSNRANPRIRPEMTSAYAVKTRVRLPNKTREQFLQDLKDEYVRHPTWKGEDIYHQMLAEGKIPKINGRTMAPRTFLEHYRVVRDSGDLVKNLSDAIMAMWFHGEKRSAYIAKRLACSKTTVYETFRKHCVNVKPYKVKEKHNSFGE